MHGRDGTHRSTPPAACARAPTDCPWTGGDTVLAGALTVLAGAIGWRLRASHPDDARIARRFGQTNHGREKREPLHPAPLVAGVSEGSEEGASGCGRLVDEW